MKFPKFAWFFIILFIFLQIYFIYEFKNYLSNETYHDYENEKVSFHQYEENIEDYKHYLVQKERFSIFKKYQSEFRDYLKNKEDYLQHKNDFQFSKTKKSSNALKKFDNAQPKQRLAFALYATNQKYACATRVVIERILSTSKRLDFDIFVYIPPDSTKSLENYVGSFNPKMINGLWNGRYFYIKPDHVPTPHKSLYKFTMLKILPLNETRYDRIIYLDSDIYGPIKDLTHLFDLPDVALASPVGYWENELCFTSLLLVYKPNTRIFNEVMSLVKPGLHDTDMNLLNTYFRPRTRGDFLLIHHEFIMLPLTYGTLTHSINKAQKNNPEYVGNPSDAYKRAYLIHFSEGGKPWMNSDRGREYHGDVFTKWRSVSDKVCKS